MIVYNEINTENTAQTTTPEYLSLDKMAQDLSESLAAHAQNPEAVYSALSGLNSEFEPMHYSLDPQSNLAANIVAGIYAPIIHAFSSQLLELVQQGDLPGTLFVPPRDAIPLGISLRALFNHKLYPTGAPKPIQIISAPINRSLLGIANNQSAAQSSEHPLVNEYILQSLGGAQSAIVEVETGIYGTTTVAIANKLDQLNQPKPIHTVKLYGLGPNPSFITYLISGGRTWITNEISEEEYTKVMQLMVLIDSIEEFGMQNRHYTVTDLEKQPDGVINPVWVEQSSQAVALAKATNRAIAYTGRKSAVKTLEQQLALAVHIVEAFPQIQALAKEGLPLSFPYAIPPMDDQKEHFATLDAAIQKGLIINKI